MFDASRPCGPIPETGCTGSGTATTHELAEAALPGAWPAPDMRIAGPSGAPALLHVHGSVPHGGARRPATGCPHRSCGPARPGPADRRPGAPAHGTSQGAAHLWRHSPGASAALEAGGVPACPTVGAAARVPRRPPQVERRARLAGVSSPGARSAAWIGRQGLWTATRDYGRPAAAPLTPCRPACFLQSRVELGGDGRRQRPCAPIPHACTSLGRARALSRAPCRRLAVARRACWPMRSARRRGQDVGQDNGEEEAAPVAISQISQSVSFSAERSPTAAHARGSLRGRRGRRARLPRHRGACWRGALARRRLMITLTGASLMCNG